VFRIHKVIREPGLTQAQTARILGIDQPKVSALIRGNLGGYSMDRLFRFLNALGLDVKIVIRPFRGRASMAFDSLRFVAGRAEPIDHIQHRFCQPVGRNFSAVIELKWQRHFEAPPIAAQTSICP
jgi:transcriptional regulator with XRE-family HTH domain